MHSYCMDGRTFLRALLSSKGDNVTKLARRLQVSGLQSQLSRYLNGITAEPRRPTLIPVAQYFDVEVDAFYNEALAEETARVRGLFKYVQNAEGELYKQQDLSGETSHMDTEPLFRYGLRNGVRPIPVIGKTMGGLPDRIWDDAGRPTVATDEYALLASDDPGAFLCLVEGTSMAPRYLPGEYALIEPSIEPELEDDVLVRLADGRTLLKRLMSKKGSVTLGSWNQSEPVLYERPENIVWMYYVSGHVSARKIKSRL